MRAVEIAKAFTRNRNAMINLSAVLAFVSGAAAGAALAMKYFEQTYEAETEREIEKAREYFKVSSERYKTLDEIVQEADDAIEEAIEKQAEADLEAAADIIHDYTTHYKQPEPKGEEIEAPPRDIFDGPTATDTIDVDDVEARDPEFAYIISYEEFMENAPDHTQIELAYYDEDDVVADDRDIPLDDPDDTIGPEALSHFGYGSKDPNTVYVRNERLDSDYQIVRARGSFAALVHGFRHSDHQKIRRFREARD